MADGLKRTATGAADTPVMRALREVLGTVVPPHIAIKLLDDAFGSWADAAIIEDEAKLKFFVEAPLRNVLERRVGPDAAQLLIADLQTILRAALVQRAAEAPSGVRSKTPVAAPRPKAAPLGKAPPAYKPTLRSLTSPMPAKTRPDPKISVAPSRRAAKTTVPAPRRRSKSVTPAASPAARRRDRRSTIPAPARGLLHVSVVTADPETPAHLATHLRGIGCISVVSDAFDLLEGLEAGPGFRPIAIFDCRRACPCLPTAAAIALELAGRLPVVLWGSADEVSVALRGMPAPPTTWIRCVAPTCDGLAAICVATFT